MTEHNSTPESSKDASSAGHSSAAEGRTAGIAGRLSLIWFAVAAVFLPVLWFGFTSMDDPRFIIMNPQIVDPANAGLAELLLQPAIGYIVPVTGLFEALLWAISDGQAWSFHLAGFLGHGINACLLFLVARRLLGMTLRARSIDRPEVAINIATAIALVFAVHPLVVEPVAWATGLKDILMGFFALLSLHVFLLDMEHIQKGGESKPSRRRLALLFAAMALLSKPTGSLIVVPVFAWLLVQRWAGARISQHQREQSQIWWQTAAFAMAIATVITLMSWFMHSELNVTDDQAVAEGSWHVFIALGHQVAHLFWPDHLFPRYPIDRTVGFEDAHAYLGVLGAVAFVWALVAARRSPFVMLGLAFALGTYLPVSNIIPFPRMVGDSYMYMPVAGLALALGTALAPSFAALSTQRLMVAMGVAVIALAVLGVRCADQVRRWGSPVDLWYPATQLHDDWPYAWMHIADGLRFVGDMDRAEHSWGQFYARAYTREFLHKVAIMYVEMERLDAAECVMVEDLYYGHDQQKAVHNYALMLASNPDYESVYPSHAIGAVRWAMDAREKDKLRWPDEVQSRLPDLLTTLGVRVESRPPDPWPRRNCPVFQAEAQPGPP